MTDYYEEPQEANAQGQQFRCPSCHANMQFDANAGQLGCEYCGTTVPIGNDEGGQSIVEYNLAQGIAMSAARGYGTEVRRTKCSECGATVNLGGNVTADHCDFCGSPQVMTQEENRNVLRPESLVPFAVTGDTAKTQFREWIKGLWFRPSALKSEAHVAELAGVYVPYWTFDSRVDSDWTAQSGYHYYESETYTTQDANGNSVTKTRQVRRTRWQPSWGNRSDHYDDVLVCASQGLPENLVTRLKTFNTSALVPYQSQYIAGWRAEEYALELNDGWKRAVGIMESEQRSRCSRDVPGDTHRALNVRNRFYQSTFKHVLLPIWISSYRYQDKAYRFLVNGQTGEVTGTAPYSWLKILLFVAFCLAVVGGLVFLYLSQQS